MTNFACGLMMAPYTPDLRRRQISPFASSTYSTANNSAMATDNIANGSYQPCHGKNSSGSEAACASSPLLQKVYTNNNPVAINEKLKQFLCKTDPFQPSSSRDSDEWRSLKCVLVGDAAVGKTSLIVSYTTNGYPQEYVPTAFDNYSVSVRVDNQPIKLQLCDTAGQDDFDNLRPLCYPNADVFLICFSVVNPASFQNVKLRWLPEVRHHSSNTPIILVGTECDLRTNIKVLLDLHRHQLNPVSEAQARHLADEIGSAAYLECSSLTLQNLKETFDAAILIGLGGGSEKNLGKDGYRRSRTSSGPSAAGRKSLQKLKEKLTTSRTNSIDSMRNPGWKGHSAGDAVLPERPLARYSTHSSASHVNFGRHSDKKLSTTSVPTTGAELNTVVMNQEGACPNRFYPVDGCQKSPAIKSKKGWRRLLCVA